MILEKGFEVKINRIPIKPRATTLVFDTHTSGMNKIEPFVYKAESSDGVKVFLTVGFTRPIPSQSELDDEKITQNTHRLMRDGLLFVMIGLLSIVTEMN